MYMYSCVWCVYSIFSYHENFDMYIDNKKRIMSPTVSSLSLYNQKHVANSHLYSSSSWPV